MASGHVNRTYSPNTWLHRPMLQNVKKALANPEPSTHGTFETCRRTRRCPFLRVIQKWLFGAVRTVFDPQATLDLIRY